MAEKLYGLYSVISNKTVRKSENLFIRWRSKNKDIPGKECIKTNRGWFIDGKNVDEKSTELWFKTTGNDRSWKPMKKTVNK